MGRLCSGWNFASNHSSDEDGRVIIIWKHPLSVTVLAQSRQHLTTEITIPSGLKFIYTAVYASNLHVERTGLWVELLELHSTLDLSGMPWIIGGDFNQILQPSEHSCPAVNSLTSQMMDFRDCLLQLGMFDHRFYGSFNTWSNKCPSNPISKKLDRILINQPWTSSYPNSSTTFRAPDFSDHSPGIIDLSVPLPVAGTRPFKFFNYLTKHPNLLSIVADSWILSGGIAADLRELSWKLKFIKGALKTLNRGNFSKIQESFNS